MLPKSVKVLGIEYKIIPCEQLRDVDQRSEHSADYHWAQIDYTKAEIRIGKNLPPVELQRTLWHEVLHSICETLSLKDLNNDEHVLDLLAYGIQSVIDENPGILFPSCWPTKKEATP